MYKLTKDAQLVWNILNGVFIVYKPAGTHYLQVKGTIINNICRDLNRMEVRPPNKYVEIEGETNKEMRVVVRDSYADHPLVVGPRYVPEDFKLNGANLMSKESSGVLVCGVNAGTKLVHNLKLSRLTKFYKIKGMLGQARSNDFSTGAIVEKSTWKHIKRHQIDHMCAAMQGSHQRRMFDVSGLDIQSQAAYDVAVKGPIRPANPMVPMVYSIKCVDFQPPEFTLEVVCINENDAYLKSLASEIGYKLKSTAHCTFLQCTQYGLFNVKDALLSKHWDLQSILDNIQICREILREHPYMLEQEHANLVQESVTQ
ncbi:hypothetical protein QAD02_016526 [Eretmocerus hayati]|uniref:Uncharacterized protein n=1 Tax=Eretmocerus hayati TaxID=131215 RepID=A0ACC2PAX0_9HYME|nr:hypothetical protein QAD02_016526 [Eretmocerus hayati]